MEVTKSEKLTSNTHLKAGDMVSGISSVNGNWRLSYQCKQCSTFCPLDLLELFTVHTVGVVIRRTCMKTRHKTNEQSKNTAKN